MLSHMTERQSPNRVVVHSGAAFNSFRPLTELVIGLYFLFGGKGLINCVIPPLEDSRDRKTTL